MSDKSGAASEGYDPFREVERFLDDIDDDERSGGFDWIKALPVALSVAGIVLYGVITIADERFYEALGITSGDVGLSYANTLVRASGLVIMFGVLVALILLLLFVGRGSAEVSYDPREIMRRAGEESRFRETLLATRLKVKERKKFQRAVRRRTYFLMGVLVLVLLAAVLPVLYINAAHRANLVSQGRSVGPVRFLGLTILPISAYAANVQWVSPNGAPVLPHNLLFLGQGGGSTPLYDPALKQVLWLPSDLISISVSQCSGGAAAACHPGATRRPVPPTPTHASSPSPQPGME